MTNNMRIKKNEENLEASSSKKRSKPISILKELVTSILPRHVILGWKEARWDLKTMQNWLLKEKYEQKYRTQCQAETDIQIFAEWMNE